jgi:hypothetical protein
MPKVRTAAKKDDNHSEIVKTFERLGWSVLDISQIPNTADILIANGSRYCVVEIKDGNKPPSKRKLTEGEKRFMEEWRGIWGLVESVDDAIDLSRLLRN